MTGATRQKVHPTVAFFYTSFLGGGEAIVPRSDPLLDFLHPCSRSLSTAFGGELARTERKSYFCATSKLFVGIVDRFTSGAWFCSRRGEAIGAAVTIDDEWRIPCEQDLPLLRPPFVLILMLIILGEDRICPEGLTVPLNSTSCTWNFGRITIW
ncbi:hypothetical protein KC19_9G147100 [Ceratodon purpureus]|uniref:Uncharacterized protein n=1 Tax=Ceratodon purpureus TaxID=3225 RepID=A0A8T0GV53_CERPU|nr:hypothetical protein KC19_9G147100 [Ceratodon purpureus]